ncbi:MAG: hypothetical protein GDA67_03115 [Nitrospira sp. CR1.3]|nr:hypothetical protein [Nitrospira sp. CR1.3]
MANRVGDKDEVSQAIARVQADVLALVFSVVGGVGLWAMTIWLVLKGGPHPGEHLQLLSNYFIGYSVTWAGSLVGLFYGALTGGVVGWVIGRIYNIVVSARQR